MYDIRSPLPVNVCRLMSRVFGDETGAAGRATAVVWARGAHDRDLTADSLEEPAYVRVDESRCAGVCRDEDDAGEFVPVEDRQKGVTVGASATDTRLNLDAERARLPAGGLEEYRRCVRAFAGSAIEREVVGDAYEYGQHERGAVGGREL
jgi:hypothetical protein